MSTSSLSPRQPSFAPVSTPQGFNDLWGGNRNFLIDPGLFLSGQNPLTSLPPLAEIVDRLRVDPKARITCNTEARRIDLSDISGWFRSLAIGDAMEQAFNLAHFELEPFMQPGGFLSGVREHLLEPWQAFLRAQGFTWERINPIVFISGRNSLTPYHMDLSHVLAFQCYGEKRFSALTDPERYAPRALRERFVRERATYPQWFHMPEDLKEEEVMAMDMAPGTLLWNVFLTPHWVSSLHDRPSMSINISHGGLKRNGEYCAFEREASPWFTSQSEKY